MSEFYDIILGKNKVYKKSINKVVKNSKPIRKNMKKAIEKKYNILLPKNEYENVNVINYNFNEYDDNNDDNEKIVKGDSSSSLIYYKNPLIFTHSAYYKN
jgi:uncharacterized membrane protein YgaE (UPF0421/DUF939 family)